MTPIGTINLRTGCKIAINTLTLPYGTSPELWKKWGRQQPPCIIASHFTMCVFVWVFERGSLAAPFFTIENEMPFSYRGGNHGGRRHRPSGLYNNSKNHSKVLINQLEAIINKEMPRKTNQGIDS